MGLTLVTNVRQIVITANNSMPQLPVRIGWRQPVPRAPRIAESRQNQAHARQVRLLRPIWPGARRDSGPGSPF
jgi:hypothetical protein